MKLILEEFQDIVLEEISHIDLILGTILPNKAAYRMSGKEHEELQRQVDELVKKRVNSGEHESLYSSSLIGA